MYGFPVNLQDSNVQKLTNDADNGFPKIQKREIFYSVRNGLWADFGTWETASGKVGLLPTSNDDVYIRNEVELNTADSFCYNLYVAQNAILNTGGFTNKNISILGNLKSSGLIKATINFCTFYLYGIDNFVNRFTEQNVGYLTMYYLRQGDQPIMNLLINTLVGGTGTKYLTSNTILKSFTNGGTFDARQFDLTINEGTGLQSSNFYKTGPGKLLFIGNVNFSNSGQFVLSGNPSVEFRGGISASGSFSVFDSGSTEWAFTTNNQTISVIWFEGNYMNCPVVLKDGITLTIDSSVVLCLNNTIDSTTSAAKVVNKGNIVFGTLESVSSFLTCQFDFTTFANAIQYKGNYTTTIPSYFTTFHSLYIAGTGTKSLGVNTTLNGNLTLNGPISSVSHGILECGNYNLSVTGTTIFQCGGLYKSGSGNLLFIGNFLSQFGYNTNRLSFTGNPNVEFRGGINRGNYDWNGGWNTGTGDWTFTTNNQTFIAPDGYLANSTCRFIVSGNITLTYTAGSQHFFANKIDGTTASSTWFNQGMMNFTGSEITPMATGIFDHLTSATSTLRYLMNSNITLPYTTYSNLNISNPSGIFYNLANNTTINNSLFISTRSGLQCSTFNLSVLGTTTSYGTLSKSGSGNILFVGLFTAPAGGVFIFNFTGNPNVEFRNGIITNPGSNGSFDPSTIFGTGTYSFTTNNQTINISAQTSNTNFNAPILISGAIVATFQTLNDIYFSGTINGDNAGSTLRMAASTTLNYRNATQPMATGILDTSTNLNTWIYGSGNQDIKGGPTTLAKQVYRNLTLNGGGTKTLQGYVSVLNTYTLTSPATLANNGFTLTNP